MEGSVNGGSRRLVGFSRGSSGNRGVPSQFTSSESHSGFLGGCRVVGSAYRIGRLGRVGLRRGRNCRQ